MTTSPERADRITRRNVFFPIDRPVPLAKGDRVRVSMAILPAELQVRWTVDVREGEHRFSHATFKGMLLAPQSVARTDPASTPRLTDRGAAERTVLDLCDGRTPLGEIERAVHHRYPHLFATLADAEAFVAAVVAGAVA